MRSSGVDACCHCHGCNSRVVSSENEDQDLESQRSPNLFLLLVTRASLIGARTLLVAPGLTTRNAIR